MSRTVVGVDDSDGARHALRWAVDHAAAFGASVEVVHAYDFRPGWIDYERAPRASSTGENELATMPGLASTASS